MEEEQNDLALFMANLINMADMIARTQKVYYDKCIEQGFDHQDALYLAYHYNPLIFNESTGNSETDDDNGY